MSNQSRQHHYDDLTQIKGIGQSTQHWLRETFDIYEYADLARLQPEALEQQLKADGKIASRSRIEQWLAQAAELAAAKSTQQVAPDEETPNMLRWKRVATFVVVFEESVTEAGQYQTNVHHMEADVTHSWDRIEKRELGDWIIQQLAIETAAPLETDTLEDAAKIPLLPETTQPTELPPLPEFTHSEKLQRYMTKASALTAQPTPETPSAVPASPEPTHEPHSSDKLRRYIAKASALTAQPTPETPATVPASPEPIDELHSSDKLRRYIAKASALTAQPAQSVAEQPEKRQTAMPSAASEQKPEHVQHSEKLQQYINKAHVLTARHSG